MGGGAPSWKYKAPPAFFKKTNLRGTPPHGTPVTGDGVGAVGSPPFGPMKNRGGTDTPFDVTRYERSLTTIAN